MAEIVGLFGVSHTPVMTNLPDAPDAALRDEVFARFRAMGDRIRALAPDAVLLISDDHLHNFFLDNLPAFCVGAADHYDTPVEHWLKVERQTVAGDPVLGMHLIGELLRHDFDPALSMELTLDHGMVTPTTLMGIHGLYPVIPLIVNTVQPPMPRMRRCIALGTAVGDAIRSYEGCRRVAVIATGGLSHDVGTPRMGIVSEEFDREFLRLLALGEPAALADYCQANASLGGNGTEEVRNWLVAHGIAGCTGFAAEFYHPVSAWYTGIAIGEWTAA